MTFSIAARCADTGMFGMAIASSSPAVAARCAWARAGVGVVATQNVTDPSLGPRGLELMALGASAAQALATLVDTAPFIEHRQLAIVDAAGRTAAFSGSGSLGVFDTAQGRDAVASGNLLASPDIPARMVQAFEAETGYIAGRLLAAMRAALARGGEAGPVHSAGLLVVDKVSWPVVDLRVDWAEEDPVGALEALWAIYAPQVGAYISRALDPTAAPRYGVPGET